MNEVDALLEIASAIRTLAISVSGIGAVLGKSQVNHIDHNKMNNSVENLEWVTPQENTDHEIRSGTNKTRNCKLKMNEKYRMGKVQLSFLVTPEENAALEKEALETGHSRTRIIRDALRKHLAEEGE